MSQGSHVAVIGAGVVGLATAAQLLREGFTVTVVDRGEPGEGTSFGNAGILSTTTAFPLATPGILRQVPGMLLDPLGPFTIRWSYLPRITPWLVRFVAAARPDRVRAYGQALSALSRSSLAAWEDLAAEAGTEGLIQKRGWLAVYETDAGFRDAEGEIARRRELGIPFEILTSDEVRQMAPALARSVRHGVWYTDAGHVTSPIGLSRALAAWIRRRGGAIRRADVTDIVLRDDRPAALATTEGEIAFDRVVVAAGAFSKRFAAALGHRVPLDTERGYHVTFPDPGLELRLPVSSSDGKFFLTPMDHGIRIAGTVELGGLALPANWKRAEVLQTQAKRLLPGLGEQKAERWMGYRPTLPDSLPVIGRATSHPNAYFAFGHNHLGLTHAAITGRMIADLMRDRPTAVDATPYRPDRF